MMMMTAERSRRPILTHGLSTLFSEQTSVKPVIKRGTDEREKGAKVLLMSESERELTICLACGTRTALRTGCASTHTLSHRKRRGRRMRRRRERRDQETTDDDEHHYDEVL